MRKAILYALTEKSFCFNTTGMCVATNMAVQKKYMSVKTVPVARSEVNAVEKAEGNRTACLNRELTSIHHEVISNLESIHGALLCMNRSIQAEGTFGVIKWDRSYKRLFRRGDKAVLLEFTLISCGFNLYKYHNKRNRKRNVA